MMEHDETVCPGCGEQAAGQQFCPSCGLQIGSSLAPATPVTTSLTEPEPSSPWSAPFTAHVPDEADDDGAAPAASSFFTTEDATTAEPKAVESGPEPPAPSFPEPFAASAAAVEANEADDEPAGETAETPEPEVVADEAPAPVLHAVSAHESNAIYTRSSSDRRAAVACIAALLFVIVVLMNRGLRR